MMHPDLICPVCGTSLPTGVLECPSCDFAGRKRGRILDLRHDPGQDTALDLDTYDAAHGVSDHPSQTLCNLYATALQTADRHLGGRILEIGSGTGNLTLGLARYGDTTGICASDVSERFLNVLADRAEKHDLDEVIDLFLFDANSLPFPEASFDLVLGHSVLHHLLRFDETIRDAARVLRPGGSAVFAEPMMETNAMVFLAAALIVEADAAARVRVLSDRMRTRLGHVGGLGRLKAGNRTRRDDGVAGLEDKFIFEATDLADIARDTGFSSHHVVQFAPVAELGALIENRLKRYCAEFAECTEQIGSFAPLLATFSTAYQSSFRAPQSQLFAFNIFMK